MRWTHTRAVQAILRAGPHDGPRDDSDVHEWMAASLTD